MNKTIKDAVQVLASTPGVLHALLQDTSDAFVYSNEGAGTWSPFDVVGHLIVCEQTNFIKRIEVILSDSPQKLLAPIDMSAHFNASKGKSLEHLLAEFRGLRKENITALLAMNITETDLVKEAMHPKIGVVTLHQVVSTWAAHDLSHISQITRVMAKQFRQPVGPFIDFLPLIQ